MSNIEINYIAPITNYNFLKSNKYYLVISFIKGNNIVIHQLQITMNNVTDTTRAYHINKMIMWTGGKITVQIFQHEQNNKLTLLFTNNINPEAFEINNISPITLYPPPKTFNLPKTTTYKNKLSFLSEQFFNYETLMPLNQCVIFFTNRPNTLYQKIPSFTFSIQSLPKGSSYNKYREMFTIQSSPIITNDYVRYMGHYQVDINKYVPKINSNFNDMILRKIDLSKRPIMYTPYLNNVITCPMDCSGIKIIDKNSFSCSLSPSDYFRFHLPYQGYLIDVKKKYLDGRICYVLNFANNYFVPKSVGEREYISVVYGHNVQMSRGYPELVNVQPDTSLYFDIVLIGNKNDESIIFTNKDVSDFMKKQNKKSLWIDQSVEICGFNKCLGQIVVKFNRGIEFDKDIRKDMGNFIKLNDIIGYLE